MMDDGLSSHHVVMDLMNPENLIMFVVGCSFLLGAGGSNDVLGWNILGTSEELCLKPLLVDDEFVADTTQYIGDYNDPIEGSR